jgi:hypothetical protein
MAAHFFQSRMSVTESIELSVSLPPQVVVAQQESPASKSGSLATVIWGIVALLALGALRIYWTWATWGDLSIDAGHEMYVPAVLSEGKMLYRDVWFHYGPAAPYFNSLLFQIFGRHLLTLYVAGSLSALASAIFLFLTGIELTFPWVGWTAGAVVVIEAFEPGLFNFPLPYSFASAYGCLVACTLLWWLVRGVALGRIIWMGFAGLLAAASLLLKLEFGVVAYAGLGLAMFLRWLPQKNWKRLGQDVFALLPGVAVCAVVIGWMVSIRGVTFITQENIMSWPTSFFMKNYGRQWLASTGLALNRQAFLTALKHTVFVAGVILAIREFLSGKRRTLRGNLLLVLLVLFLVAYSRMLLWKVTPIWVAQNAFFPRAMVLYTMIGAGILAWRFRKNLAELRSAQILLLLAFSCLLAFRMLLNMQAEGYAIYYNGPVTLAYLVLLSMFFAGTSPERQKAARAAGVLVVGCLSVVMFRAQYLSSELKDMAWLETKYGKLLVKRTIAENYQAGIAFLKGKYAQHENVLILPEDTSLYFFSDTQAPTRVYAFNPGILAPGKMTEEFFHEMDTRNVKYLLWSNRTFAEYGVPMLGQDFDQELAAYLTNHYKPLGLLTSRDEKLLGLAFMVWQREDEAARP